MTATVIIRRVGSVPVRTATETWQTIVALIASPGSIAQVTLNSVVGIAAMLIAESYTQEAPIIVTPSSGPRIRVYTIHGDDALDAMEEEAGLASWPTTGAGWSVSLPCGNDDVAFAAAQLSPTREVTVRDVALGVHLNALDQTIDVRDQSRPLDLKVDTSWLET